MCLATTKILQLNICYFDTHGTINLEKFVKRVKWTHAFLDLSKIIFWLLNKDLLLGVRWLVCQSVGQSGTILKADKLDITLILSLNWLQLALYILDLSTPKPKQLSIFPPKLWVYLARVIMDSFRDLAGSWPEVMI